MRQRPTVTTSSRQRSRPRGWASSRQLPALSAPPCTARGREGSPAIWRTRCKVRVQHAALTAQPGRCAACVPQGPASKGADLMTLDVDTLSSTQAWRSLPSGEDGSVQTPQCTPRQVSAPPSLVLSHSRRLVACPTLTGVCSPTARVLSVTRALHCTLLCVSVGWRCAQKAACLTLFTLSRSHQDPRRPGGQLCGKRGP